jgi:hypothetical protein
MIGYSGSVFSSEATYVDGVPHGWMRIHNVQYVKDFESEQPAVQQICYRHGRKAPDSACAAGS